MCRLFLHGDLAVLPSKFLVRSEMKIGPQTLLDLKKKVFEMPQITFSMSGVCIIAGSGHNYKVCFFALETVAMSMCQFM